MSVGIQLTGRNVTEFQYFNALAITDTTNHNSSNPPYHDVSGLGGSKMLICYNTLNQPVTVAHLTSTQNGSGALQANQTVSVAAGKSVTITSADIRELGQTLQNLGVRLSCATAPTSGSVSVWMEGVEV